MAIEVKVPILAESVAEATLMKWHKKVGDNVKRGDSLIDIETDKVTLEVAAPDNGILSEILKYDGEEVQSDEVIARIDTGGEAVVEKTVEPEQEKEPVQRTETAPQQQSLPDIENKPVKKETKLSPAVRNLLQQHNLESDNIKPAAGSDRITKEDVLKHVQLHKHPAPQKEVQIETTIKTKPELVPDIKTEKNSTTQIKTPQPSQPVIGGNRPEERVPMTRLRKRVAERLLSAQHENAILTTFNEVNMQPVIDLRNRYRDEFEKTHGVKLGFMSFFTKAAVEALKKFPVINASVDGGNIVYHGYFDIGIAVSAPKGLVVPVLRDVDNMSFADIEANIREFGEKARDSRLTIEELTGGTFTITNGGVFGSLLSTPILNPPQSAILGMHKMQERPIAENGNVVIKPMMYLALSYDHRIIDGREAVQFLVSIKEQLEDPARLLLQV